MDGRCRLGTGGTVSMPVGGLGLGPVPRSRESRLTKGSFSPHSGERTSSTANSTRSDRIPTGGFQTPVSLRWQGDVKPVKPVGDQVLVHDGEVAIDAQRDNTVSTPTTPPRITL